MLLFLARNAILSVSYATSECLTESIYHRLVGLMMVYDLVSPELPLKRKMTNDMVACQTFEANESRIDITNGR